MKVEITLEELAVIRKGLLGRTFSGISKCRECKRKVVWVQHTWHANGCNLGRAFEIADRLMGYPETEGDMEHKLEESVRRASALRIVGVRQ